MSLYSSSFSDPLSPLTAQFTELPRKQRSKAKRAMMEPASPVKFATLENIEKAIDEIATYSFPAKRFEKEAIIPMPKSLQRLAQRYPLELIGENLSAKGLREINAQMTTILQFANKYADRFGIEGKNLVLNIIETRKKLIQECLDKLASGTSPTDAKILIDTINQAIGSMREKDQPFKYWESLHQELSGYISAFPAAENLLAKSMEHIQTEIVECSKKNVSDAIRRVSRVVKTLQPTDKLTTQLTIDLRTGRTVVNLVDSPNVGEQQEDSFDLMALRDSVVDFLNCGRPSKESQQACDILITDLENILETLMIFDPPGAPQAADTFMAGKPRPKHLDATRTAAFFVQVIIPLNNNQWLKEILENSPSLATRFDAIRDQALMTLIENGYTQIEKILSKKDPKQALDALESLKRRVEYLSTYGEQRECMDLIDAINRAKSSLMSSRKGKVPDKPTISRAHVGKCEALSEIVERQKRPAIEETTTLLKRKTRY